MAIFKHALASPVRPSARTQSSSIAMVRVLETPGQDVSVGNVLQRQTACACGGGCPRCAGVQAKLKVNPPGDRYEQEADRVAEQVMRMPHPAIQRAPT